MKRYLLDHIPKTGGTSLHTVFASVLGTENVSPLIQFKRFSHAIAENDSFQLIQGHFRFMPGDRLPGDRLAATLLRDPVERCLSTYFFYRLDAQASIGSEFKSIELAKTLSLAEYVNCEEPSVLDLLDNYQARHFLPLKWDGVSAPSDDMLLAVAAQALEEYDLVGVHEMFNDFIDVLCYRWSWPRVDTIPREKVTSSRPSKQDIEPEIFKKLRALNEIDIELYETAKALFEKARRGVIRDCVDRSMSLIAPVESAGGISTNVGKKSEPVKIAIHGGADFGNRKAAAMRAEITGRISLGAALFCGELVDLRVVFAAREPIDNLTLGIQIVDEFGRLVFGTNSRYLGFVLSIDRPGEFFVDFSFQAVLGNGGYWLGVALHRGESHLEECYHWVDRLAFFEVVGKIGYHFEGSVCLQPTMQIGENQEAGGLVANELTSKKELRHFTIHNPVLTVPSASFLVINLPETMVCNEVVGIQIEVTNSGSELWLAHGQRPVRACYRWLEASGRIFVYDGERSSLPRGIGPGDTVRLLAMIKAPEITGSFVLRITLVQENGIWFDEVGGSCIDVSVVVQP